jgi:hypothetical protein
MPLWENDGDTAAAADRSMSPEWARWALAYFREIDAKSRFNPWERMLEINDALASRAVERWRDRHGLRGLGLALTEHQ